MSRVTMCHHVTMCQIFCISFFFGQSGEASQGRVCYQRGLPRLVCVASPIILLGFFSTQLCTTQIKQIKHTMLDQSGP